MTSDRITFPVKAQMSTIYLKIEPQPTGEGLNDVLDSEWLHKPFNGLLLPTTKIYRLSSPTTVQG